VAAGCANARYTPNELKRYGNGRNEPKRIWVLESSTIQQLLPRNRKREGNQTRYDDDLPVYKDGTRQDRPEVRRMQTQGIEMNKNQYVTNVSPQRDEVIACLQKEKMTTSEVAQKFGWSRERAYNILNNLNRHMLIGKEGKTNTMIWGPFTKQPDKPLREMPVNNGTMREPLNIGFMASPYRDGSMDAFQLRSGGV
jgi:hypothetical protein